MKLALICRLKYVLYLPALLKYTRLLGENKAAEPKKVIT